LYDATQKKVLYEKAIDTSVEYLTTWIHISREGKYLTEVETEEGGGDAEISEFLDAKTFKPIPGLTALVELKGLFMGERYIYGVFKDQEADSRSECVFDTQTRVNTPIDSSFYVSAYVVDLPDRGMFFGQMGGDDFTGATSFWKLPGLLKIPVPADLDKGIPFSNRQGSVIGTYTGNRATFYDQNRKLLKFYQMAADKPDSILELDPEIKDGKVLDNANRVILGSYDGTTGQFQKFFQGRNPDSSLVDWTDNNDGGMISVFPDSRSAGFWLVCNGIHSLIVYVGNDLKIKKILRSDMPVKDFYIFDPDRYAILALYESHESNVMKVFPLN
jgi:hypothetical protein